MSLKCTTDDDITCPACKHCIFVCGNECHKSNSIVAKYAQFVVHSLQ